MEFLFNSREALVFTVLICAVKSEIITNDSQLFKIYVNSSLEDTNTTTEDYPDSEDTNTPTEAPFYRLENEDGDNTWRYPTGCGYLELCDPCTICVNDECLPYIMFDIFDDHCQVRDKCLNNTACGPYPCVFSYGDYFCKCPKGRYGKHCDLEETEGNITLSELMALFPDSVAAGTPVGILVIWADSRHTNRDVNVAFITDENSGFTDELVIDEYKVQPVNPRVYCEHSRFLQHTRVICDNLPFGNIYFGAEFKTEFPYLKLQNQLLLSSNATDQFESVQIVLPGDRVILGYKIGFTLKVWNKSTLFAISSKYKIFVFYPNPKLYISHCFPKEVSPRKPCTTRIHAIKNDTSDYTVTLRERSVIRADVVSPNTCKRMDTTYTIWMEDDYMSGHKPKINHTGSLYNIRPYTLIPNKYRVKITVSSFWQGDQEDLMMGSNFMMCWFEILKLPLEAHILGGSSRMVYAYDELVMDSSLSQDPNRQASRQQNLFFEWWCNETYDYCKHYTTKARQYKIPAPLVPGVVIGFTLKVYAYTYEPVFDYQAVTTTAIEFASFSIRCKENCGVLINPDKTIYLEIHVPGKELPNDTFIWTYSHTGENNSRIIGDILDTVTEDYVAIIKREALDENSVYTFIAQRENPYGHAKTLVKTCQRPKFQCTIEPLNGTMLTTVFSILCNSDDSSAITYTFFVLENASKTVGSNILPIYIGYNIEGVLTRILLYSDTVYVRAMVESGCYNTVNLTVELKHTNQFSTSRSVARKLITQTRNIINRSVKHYGHRLWDSKHGGYFNLVVFLCYYYRNNHMGVILQWKDVTQFLPLINFNNPIQLKRLLSVFVHLMKIEPLVPVMGTNDEFYQQMDLIIRVLFKMTMNFERAHSYWNDDRMLTLEEVTQIGNSLFKCLTDILEVSTQSAILNMGLIIKHGDPELTLGMISDDHTFTKSSFGFGFQRYKKILETTKENTLLENIVFKKLKYMTELTLDKALHHLGYALFARLLPMEPAFLFTNHNYDMIAMVDSPRYLVNFKSIPLRKSQSASYIKISDELGKELYSYSTFIRVKILTLDTNPYWWDIENDFIKSQIIFTTFAMKKKTRWIKLSVTMKHLDIYLQMKYFNMLIVTGLTYFPMEIATPREKDISVNVYRVIPPSSGGRGKLCMRFLDFSLQHSFRVVMVQNYRPDYEYMMNHAIVLTEEFPEMSLSYDTGNINVALYIGILPGIKVNPTEVMNFTFESYIVRCLTRLYSMWLTEKCSVGNDSYQNVVHCQCQRIGMTAAAIMAPDIQNIPIIDFYYSRDVEFNILPSMSLVIFAIFIVGVYIWAYMKDKQITLKNKVIVLEDNFPGEEWAYLLGVYTGTRWSSGTTSNVGIKLFGELSESRAHILRSSKRNTLQTYSDDWFLMFTTERLGNIKSICLWSDFTGKRPTWYCRKVVVYDYTAQIKYMFRLGNWFYVDLYNDMVKTTVRSLPLHHMPLYPQIIDNILYGIREKHYLVSLIKHHPQNILTRTEIFASIVTSVMFGVLFLTVCYKYDNGGSEDYPYFHLTPRDLLIGLFSYIIVVPIICLCHILFKRKFITSHLTTWKLTNKKYNMEENLPEIQIKEKDETEEREKDKIDMAENYVKNKTNVIKKIKALKTRFNSQQLPVTISHKSADQPLMIRRRLYTAWALVLLLLAVFCFIITVVGINMGPVKSQVCLIICVTFTVGLFTVNFLCVLVHMVIYSCLKRKQYDEPLFSCDPRLGMRLELVGNRDHLDKLLAVRSQPEYHPLTPSNLEKIRDKISNKRVLTAVLDVAVVLCIFLLVFFNTLNNWPTDDFYYCSHLKYLLNHGVTDHHLRLDDAKNLRDLKRYFEDTLTHVYARKQWYNGMPVSFPDPCVSRMMRHIYPRWRCVPKVTDTTEDRTNYTIGWKNKGADEGYLGYEWNYQPPRPDRSTTIDYSKSGSYYSNGGYITNLGRTTSNTRSILWKMKQSNWLSKAARVIFIDSSIYNPNINKISIITICIELKPTYGLYKKLMVLNLTASYEEMSIQSALLVVLAVIIALLIFYFTISISKKGFNLFFSFWNILDFAIIILLILNYAYNIKHIFHSKFDIQTKLNTAQDRFQSYGWLEYYCWPYRLMYVILVVFCSVRLFKNFSHTFQLTAVLSTLCSTGKILLVVTILSVVMMYCQFYMLDSLLCNAQLTANRLPLVNKLDLDNYANQYTFPDKRLVPFLYCQFCSTVIFIFSILIIYHYRIARRNTRIVSNVVDVIANLKEKIKRWKERNQIRLRGGADCAHISKHTRDAICLVAIQDMFLEPNIREHECKLKPMKNFVNLKIKHNTVRHRDMSAVLQNMDVKLNKILINLTSFEASL